MLAEAPDVAVKTTVWVCATPLVQLDGLALTLVGRFANVKFTWPENPFFPVTVTLREVPVEDICNGFDWLVLGAVAMLKDCGEEVAGGLVIELIVELPPPPHEHISDRLPIIRSAAIFMASFLQHVFHRFGANWGILFLSPHVYAEVVKFFATAHAECCECADEAILSVLELLARGDAVEPGCDPLDENLRNFVDIKAG